jgi:hypothetical protein
MLTPSCPDNGRLTELAIEGLDPADLLSHVEACPDCLRNFQEIGAVLAGLKLLITSRDRFLTSPPTRHVPAVIDPYFVIGPIGEIAGATTYRAVLASNPTKEFSIILADEPWADHERRQPEFEATCDHLARFNHPNIARVEAFGSFEDRPYIVHDYVEGEPLGRLIGQRPMTLREAATMGGLIARALVAAHKAGVVHGALSIDSIRIDRQGRPVIVDLGVSKLLPTFWTSPTSADDLIGLGAVLRRLARSNVGLEALEALAGRAETGGVADLGAMIRALDYQAHSRRKFLLSSAFAVIFAMLSIYGLFRLQGAIRSMR